MSIPGSAPPIPWHNTVRIPFQIQPLRAILDLIPTPTHTTIAHPPVLLGWGKRITPWARGDGAEVRQHLQTTIPRDETGEDAGNALTMTEADLGSGATGVATTMMAGGIERSSHAVPKVLWVLDRLENFPTSTGRATLGHLLDRNPLEAVVAQTSNDAVDTAPEKQKPNFAQTGALAAETNTFAGVVLKYHEPAEARKPPTKDAWRLYIFKGSDLLETVELGPRSCWLVGRERLVVDFPVDHPSCSKQHAVIQFRHVTKTNEYGDKDGRVRPYIIDLDSANGTSVNGDRIPATRYVELQDKDMIQFGLSTREYVLMLPPRD
ncbi:MAG: hypothetical protein M1833_004184 [Piccolia ochrophora]|nr:MAG: hypothetical protein M1833_004184 [Piccolia ochrophora]